MLIQVDPLTWRHANEVEGVRVKSRHENEVYVAVKCYGDNIEYLTFFDNQRDAEFYARILVHNINLGVKS